MLPLGDRVQEKIEKLLDKHMQSIGTLAPCPWSFSPMITDQDQGHPGYHYPRLARKSYGKRQGGSRA